jgi:hypothetical protein
MAKCPICNGSKGKRACHLHSAPICSKCCGSLRQATTCEGCGFYKPPVRKYEHVERFSPDEFDMMEDLHEIGFPIESALCALDRERGFSMSDREAIRILEVLIDKYVFKDEEEWLRSKIDELGCASVVEAADTVLTAFVFQDFIKVLGLLRHVAVRRIDVSGRRHMNMLQHFIGKFS